MASSEVDQKFLGRLAQAVERDNPFLSQMLYKILGLSINLADKLVAAKKQRRMDSSRLPQFLDLVYHIVWLAREGLNMLEQYVLPWVGPTHNPELIVLACKLRASFLHIYVLFYNQPAVSPMNVSNPDILSTLASATRAMRTRVDDTFDDSDSSTSSIHEGGPVGPPPGLGSSTSSNAAAIVVKPRLIQEANYLPTANEYFKTAARLADELLWGSHSLRLSVKTEYAAFLYECVHDAEASRQLAKDTITEVYEAQEGMSDDMFEDACELVAVLGKMKKRGLTSSRQGSSRAGTPTAAIHTAPSSRAPSTRAPSTRVPSVPPGMENAI
jgi:hypothetical protein